MIMPDKTQGMILDVLSGFFVEVNMKNNDFTSGSILPKLLKFMLPVLMAMFLQALYGAVDLLIVGQFGTTADVSAVSTGSQIITTLTNILVSFSMGITVSVAQRIGQKRPNDAAQIIGTGLYVFFFAGAALTLISVAGANLLAKVMHAPDEALKATVSYIRICGGGFLIITSYNLLGSIFRGLGDSKTPLAAVGIACVCNIIGDMIFVSVFHLGAAGAAIATVIAQFISVVISFFLIRRIKLPFELHRSDIRPRKASARNIIHIGTPIALQDFLVGISFLVLVAIVNQISVDASAGVGVANKVCTFIMLIPISFMQSMSAFVAQNQGAGMGERSRAALRHGIAVSATFGVAMFFITFFFYLKAYAIDCLQTCFLFCFIGYFNGIEKTKFVMLQGLCGAFLVRIPFALVMQHYTSSLSLIGLAIPCSTLLQIAMCFAVYVHANKRSVAK